MLAILRTNGLQLRLKCIGSECAEVILEGHLLDIQLVFDDVNEERIECVLCLYIHVTDRLTVLHGCGISRCTTEQYHVQYLIHVLLEGRVDHRRVGLRETAEMNGCLRRRIHAAYQVTVDGLGDERNHRCRYLRECYQCGIKRHVGIDLILLHALRPEALSRTTHIPVRHVVDEILHRVRGLRDTEVREVVIDFADHGVQLTEQPAVHDAELRIVEAVLRRVEVVNVGVQNEECIGVPERRQELTLSLDDGLIMEAVRQPWCGVRVEEPADGVSAVLLERIHRVDCIALRLTHLLSVFILNMAQYEDVLVRCLIKEDRTLGEEGIEPSTGLVHGLTDELCRELGLEELLILKRIVMLCIWHRTGIEPAVDDFRYTVHLAAAVRAAQGDLVDIRLVKLDVLVAHIVGAVAALTLGLQLCEELVVVRGTLAELLDGADGLLLTAARAGPDVERGAPVTVT